MATPSEEAPKKTRRGRPAKKSMLVESSAAESSGSTNVSTSVSSIAFVAPQSSSSINVAEFELALKALPMKVRASTAAIYRMPLENWKVCLNAKKNYILY